MRRAHERTDACVSDPDVIDRLSGIEAQLFVVADGVGGRPGGELASTTAVTTLLQYVDEAVACYQSINVDQEQAFLAQLEGAVHRAHERILEEHFGQKTTGSFTIVARGEPGSAQALVVPVQEAAARASAALPTSEVASVQPVSDAVVTAQIVSALAPADAKGYTDDMRAAVGEVPGAEVFVSGQAAIEHDLDPVFAEDLKVGELYIAIPIALVILVFVFGTLAFLLPFVFAGVAIPTTLAIIWVAANFMELTTYLQNLVMLIHTGRPKSVGIGQGLANAVEIGGVRVPGIQLLTMVVTAGLLVALVLFLKKTPLGIQMRAAAENFQMARLLGMPANRVIALAFAISGLLGGAVSLLLTIQTGTLDLRMGLMPVVYAFFATVIGGMGSLPGAALGGFLVGVASVLLQTYLPADLRPFRDAGVFTLVILILLVRPQGLIVTSAAKERV